jgi:hypothetical protein
MERNGVCPQACGSKGKTWGFPEDVRTPMEMTHTALALKVWNDRT